MPHGFLQSLHQLWAIKVIDVAGVISAISAYGYELNYLDLKGIAIEKENEKFEFRYNQ